MRRAPETEQDLPTKAARERIAELGGGPIPPLTSLYRALASAEEEGWIEVIPSDATTGGRPAQTYRITGLLFGVSPADAATLLAVSALVLAVAAATNLLPAWRAMRVDPVLALRRE